MAKINLETLSLKDLRDLERELPAAIAAKTKADREAVRAKMAEIAHESGFELEEILGSAKRGAKARNGAAVKYRNPENPNETWSGRGRMATWLKDKLTKRGVKIEDFAA